MKFANNVVVRNASLHKMLQQGRALRPWSMSRWLEGRHPDPYEWGFFTAGPGETFAFLCPRASVPPLLEPESIQPRWSRDFWDTTLDNLVQRILDDPHRAVLNQLRNQITHDIFCNHAFDRGP